MWSVFLANNLSFLSALLASLLGWCIYIFTLKAIIDKIVLKSAILFYFFSLCFLCFCSSVSGTLYLLPLIVVPHSPCDLGRISILSGGGMILSGLLSTVRLEVGKCQIQVTFFCWVGGFDPSCYDFPLVLASQASSCSSFHL